MEGDFYAFVKPFVKFLFKSGLAYKTVLSFLCFSTIEVDLEDPGSYLLIETDWRFFPWAAVLAQRGEQ